MTPEFVQEIEKIRMDGNCSGGTGGAWFGCLLARIQKKSIIQDRR